MKVNCAICSKEQNHQDCHREALTPVEQKFMAERGASTDDLFYCMGCWKVMQSPHAEQFMATQFERQLRGLGVRNAKTVAETYLTKLKELRSRGH